MYYELLSWSDESSSNGRFVIDNPFYWTLILLSMKYPWKISVVFSSMLVYGPILSANSVNRLSCPIGMFRHHLYS